MQRLTLDILTEMKYAPFTGFGYRDLYDLGNPDVQILDTDRSYKCINTDFKSCKLGGVDDPHVVFKPHSKVKLNESNIDHFIGIEKLTLVSVMKIDENSRFDRNLKELHIGRSVDFEAKIPNTVRVATINNKKYIDKLPVELTELHIHTDIGNIDVSRFPNLKHIDYPYSKCTGLHDNITYVKCNKCDYIPNKCFHLDVENMPDEQIPLTVKTLCLYRKMRNIEHLKLTKLMISRMDKVPNAVLKADTIVLNNSKFGDVFIDTRDLKLRECEFNGNVKYSSNKLDRLSIRNTNLPKYPKEVIMLSLINFKIDSNTKIGIETVHFLNLVRCNEDYNPEIKDLKTEPYIIWDGQKGQGHANDYV